MMVEPHLKDLEKQVDSKYTLVTLAAKRARELDRWRSIPCR